jgi:dihydropteroate synthase
MLDAVPAGARVYLRPTGFVEAPFGHDGKLQRLAGGLLWFSAVELIVRADGRRIVQRLVPVEAFDSLPDAARPILARLTAPRPPLALGERVLRFDQPHIMSILNLTPDSFSDGGRLADAGAAAEMAVAHAAAGASVIDIGGESTRPGAAPVWEGDEIARVAPVIERLAHSGMAISIDTRKAAVMEAALAAGAHRSARRRSGGARRGAGGADAPSGPARNHAAGAAL